MRWDCHWVQSSALPSERNLRESPINTRTSWIFSSLEFKLAVVFMSCVKWLNYWFETHLNKYKAVMRRRRDTLNIGQDVSQCPDEWCVISFSHWRITDLRMSQLTNQNQVLSHRRLMYDVCVFQSAGRYRWSKRTETTGGPMEGADRPRGSTHSRSVCTHLM